ncbi:hypothetical protein DSO57_1025643 [Entomophthora muscae]|uniref:Uncharacterized protein n=1 Tax=Entomophthora muscae TaxID=34485 RepID=A0ACC2S4A3_9FUNG|nr:hypothetical protein DSO57_1025643 [Entomophthora muscae]
MKNSDSSDDSFQDKDTNGPPISPQCPRNISIICIDPVERQDIQGPSNETQYFNVEAKESNKGVNFTWGLKDDSGLRPFRIGEVSVPLLGTVRLFKEKVSAPEFDLENTEELGENDSSGGSEGKELDAESAPGYTNEMLLRNLQGESSTPSSRPSSPYPFSDSDLSEEETIVGIISIPSKLSVQEIMLFLDPFVILPQLKSIRLIKSSLDTCPISSTRVMAFIKFQTFNSALTFYNHLNCQPFDVFEEATCYGIFVDAIQAKFEKTHLKTSNLYELPTCPACLVRLDGTVTGLRGEAVSDDVPLGWGLGAESNRCLVCWHAQHHPTDDHSSDAKLKAELACNICQSVEDRWSCLICGHLGCGRYKRAHARKHAEEKGHMLALELGTVRVWDYLGDCYVHRLVRNQADGQIVALPETQIPSFSAEDKPKKMIDASEEIALLKMQLESQHILYQAQLDAGLKIQSQLLLQVEAATTEALFQKNEHNKLMRQLAVEEDRSNKLKSLLAQIEPQVKEDEAIFKQLLANIKEVRCYKSDMINKVEDLSSQLQDINFFLKAQGRIARDMPELQHGTLELVSAEQSDSTIKPPEEPSAPEVKKQSKKKGRRRK